MRPRHRLPLGLSWRQAHGACCDCISPCGLSALEPSLEAPLPLPLPIPPFISSPAWPTFSALSLGAASARFQHHLEDRTGQALPPRMLPAGPCGLPRVGEMGTRRQIRRTGPDPAIGPRLSARVQECPETIAATLSFQIGCYCDHSILQVRNEV